jgi:hypothetical protein
MASKGSDDKRARGRRVLRVIQFLSVAAAATVAMGGIIYAGQCAEQFLIRDARFNLAGPADYGKQSPNLRIEGVTYASRWQIQRVFERDFGRSVFLFPLAERRRELARLGWVKDDSIVRTWPNQITVRIEERRPVAFIQATFGAMVRYALLDPDGIILDQPVKARFDLPVVLGVTASDPIDTRAAGRPCWRRWEISPAAFPKWTWPIPRTSGCASNWTISQCF